jgi:hypothetical protein
MSKLGLRRSIPVVIIATLIGNLLIVGNAHATIPQCAIPGLRIVDVSKVVRRNLRNLTGEQLFLGMFFADGPAASLFPTLPGQRYAPAVDLPLSVEILNVTRETDPSLFGHFKTDLASRNAPLVGEGIAAVSKAIVAAIPRIEQLHPDWQKTVNLPTDYATLELLINPAAGIANAFQLFTAFATSIINSTFLTEVENGVITINIVIQDALAFLIAIILFAGAPAASTPGCQEVLRPPSVLSDADVRQAGEQWFARLLVALQ